MSVFCVRLCRKNLKLNFHWRLAFLFDSLARTRQDLEKSVAVFIEVIDLIC